MWNDSRHDGCFFNYHTIMKTITFSHVTYSIFSAI
ncbi:hypothetical protein PARMER_01436 [Parabacteroides merdae ATCC 43184]|jgi:hypothetical protein|nr:hypothetical protein PARMER_01436 [Parabacteroides merdae ATCC 43184]